MSKFKATQDLPETYQLEDTLDLSRDGWLSVGLNLLGLLVFLLAGGFFVQAALILRGENEFRVTFGNVLVALPMYALVVILSIVN